MNRAGFTVHAAIRDGILGALGPVRELPEDIWRKCTRDSLPFDPSFGSGEDALDTLTMMIDRTDTFYRP